MISSKKTLAALTFLFASISANASLIIGDTTAGGNWFPFGGSSSSNGWGPTFQMQYDASLFSSDITIDTLRFYQVRDDLGTAVGNGTYTISLSTATGPLTSSAADNLGSDNTVVYTGALELNGTFLDFDITDFFYDVSAGDLLLNITATGNTVSQASFFASNDDGGVDRLFRDVVSNQGWLTTGFNQFSNSDSTAVNEPSILALFGLAFAGLGLRKRYKTKTSA